MEDMRNQIADYLETQGYDRDEFIQNANDEEIGEFFIIDADQAYLLGANHHPTYPESNDDDLEEFETIQAIYNKFIQALPAYERMREREQERITLALVAKKSRPVKSSALKTALKKGHGFGSKKMRRRKTNRRKTNRRKTNRRKTRRRKKRGRKKRGKRKKRK